MHFVVAHKTRPAVFLRRFGANDEPASGTVNDGNVLPTPLGPELDAPPH